MNALADITPPSRTGMRRVFLPWEFRHLRVLAGVRIGGGIVLTACGLLALSFGENDSKTYWWAAFFLVAAALALGVGFWQLAIARSAPPRA